MDASYEGMWHESIFEYIFKPNGSFTFKSYGHYGNTTTKGKYVIVDSVILLHPLTDWDLQQGVLMPRLILNQQHSCFYDFRKNYYCINEEDRKPLFTAHREKLEAYEKRLLELEEVQQALNGYPEPQTVTERMNYPKFEFQGTMFLDENIFYKMSLRERNLEALYGKRTLQYQSYLLNEEQNEIYQNAYFGKMVFVGSVY
ncbi:MAG: hypothetical protein AAGG68_26450 [Bacteroidota bacterium]